MEAKAKGVWAWDSYECDITLREVGSVRCYGISTIIKGKMEAMH